MGIPLGCSGLWEEVWAVRYHLFRSYFRQPRCKDRLRHPVGVGFWVFGEYLADLRSLELGLAEERRWAQPPDRRSALVVTSLEGFELQF